MKLSFLFVEKLFIFFNKHSAWETIKKRQKMRWFYFLKKLFFTKPADAGAIGAASEGKAKAMGAAAAEPEG